MSSVRMVYNLGRMVRTPICGVIPFKNNSVISQPCNSSYISIWSSLTRSKAAQANANENSDTPPPPNEASSEAQNNENLKGADSDNEQVNDLMKALGEMKENRDEVTDKYKRAIAENENIRKRLMKQVEDTKIFAIQSFCKDLLEVADVLGKATECVPKEEVTDKNPHLKNLYEGLTMTQDVLKSVFNRHGLQEVNPIGEKFNPNFHEAIFEKVIEDKPSGTVVIVSKTGYLLKERVIRPALVGVSKK